MVLKKRMECAQIGCYDQAVTYCEVCGFLCRKCDSYFHRSGSRVATFNQQHHRRPVQLEPPAPRAQSVNLSPSMLSRMPAVPAPGGVSRLPTGGSSRAVKTPGSSSAAARPRVGTASSRASLISAQHMVEPPHVTEARQRLTKMEASQLRSRRVAGHYVKPYCRMLAKESLQNEIQRWEQTKDTVVLAFQDAGHHLFGTARPKDGIDEDGAESSLSSHREALMPAGLEGAVPLPLGNPEVNPSSRDVGGAMGGEEVVWFPRGPDEDQPLDAGQSQLLAEAREGESRGEDKGCGL